MLIRIVRMTLIPDALDRFLAIYDEARPRIRSSEGCLHLELWQDQRYSNIVTTYSVWNSDESLQSYRKSPLFQSTWARTRPFFAAPAVAFSHHSLREDTPGDTR